MYGSHSGTLMYGSEGSHSGTLMYYVWQRREPFWHAKVLSGLHLELGTLAVIEHSGTLKYCSEGSHVKVLSGLHLEIWVK